MSYILQRYGYATAGDAETSVSKHQRVVYDSQDDFVKCHRSQNSSSRNIFETQRKSQIMAVAAAGDRLLIVPTANMPRLRECFIVVVWHKRPVRSNRRCPLMLLLRFDEFLEGPMFMCMCNADAASSQASANESETKHPKSSRLPVVFLKSINCHVISEGFPPMPLVT